MLHIVCGSPHTAGQLRARPGQGTCRDFLVCGAPHPAGPPKTRHGPKGTGRAEKFSFFISGTHGTTKTGHGSRRLDALIFAFSIFGAPHTAALRSLLSVFVCGAPHIKWDFQWHGLTATMFSIFICGAPHSAGQLRARHGPKGTGRAEKFVISLRMRCATCCREPQRQDMAQGG
jgi:hypothetical protein